MRGIVPYMYLTVEGFRLPGKQFSSMIDTGNSKFNILIIPYPTILTRT